MSQLSTQTYVPRNLSIHVSIGSDRINHIYNNEICNEFLRSTKRRKQYNIHWCDSTSGGVNLQYFSSRWFTFCEQVVGCPSIGGSCLRNQRISNSFLVDQVCLNKIKCRRIFFDNVGLNEGLSCLLHRMWTTLFFCDIETKTLSWHNRILKPRFMDPAIGTDPDSWRIIFCHIP